MPTVRLPGLIDVHVHLREPGGEHKEEYSSGTAAALAGGVTCVLDMPNTTPPTTTLDRLIHKRELARRGARCDVGVFAGASNDNPDTIAELAPLACALKIYVNDTFGPLRIDDPALLEQHIANWPVGKPIVAHAEADVLPLVLALAQRHGKHLHVAHVARRVEIEMIAAARQGGANVTCEVTPHHLFLDTDALPRLGSFGEVRPRIATPDDRAALWQHLDVIDCVATDHAPHTIAEKQSDRVPPGMPGLETTLPLLLTAVHQDRLSLDRLIELTSSGPRRVFGLPEQEETWVEAEIGGPWTITNEAMHTRAGWTPFAGMQVTARVARTVLRGVTVFDGERVLAAPGSGRVLYGE